MCAFGARNEISNQMIPEMMFRRHLILSFFWPDLVSDDFNWLLRLTKLIQQSDLAGNAGDGNDLISNHLVYMTEIISLGSFDEKPGRTTDVEDSCSLIRLDYDDESKSVTGSVDVNSQGTLHLKLDAVQQIIVHAIQDLFIPTGIHQCELTSVTGIFPDGSLGSFMLALINPGLGENREEAAFTKDDEAKKKNSLVESIQAMASFYSEEFGPCHTHFSAR